MPRTGTAPRRIFYGVIGSLNHCPGALGEVRSGVAERCIPVGRASLRREVEDGSRAARACRHSVDPVRGLKVRRTARSSRNGDRIAVAVDHRQHRVSRGVALTGERACTTPSALPRRSSPASGPGPRSFSAHGGGVRVRGAGGAPKVRRMCSSVEVSSSCVASRVASRCSQRRVAARFSAVQHSSA